MNELEKLQAKYISLGAEGKVDEAKAVFEEITKLISKSKEPEEGKKKPEKKETEDDTDEIKKSFAEMQEKISTLTEMVKKNDTKFATDVPQVITSRIGSGEYKNATPEMLEKMDDKERVGLWLLNSMAQDLKGSKKREFEKLDDSLNKFYSKNQHLITKANNEGTAGDGGYLVPTEFETGIDRVIASYGGLIKLARQVPMNGITKKVSKGADSILNAYWINELADGTISQPTYAETTLTAKKVGYFNEMSMEIFDDAPINIYNDIVNMGGIAIAKKIEDEMVKGTGSPFTGILNDLTPTQQVMTGTTFASITYNELNNLRRSLALYPEIDNGAVFVMHPDIITIIDQIKDTTGRPILQDPSGNQDIQKLFGKPVYTSPSMPNTTGVATPFVIYGNLSFGFLIGNRKEMTIDTTREGTLSGSSTFLKDAIGVRIIKRLGMAMHKGKAITVLSTHA